MLDEIHEHHKHRVAAMLLSLILGILLVGVAMLVYFYVTAGKAKAAVVAARPVVISRPVMVAPRVAPPVVRASAPRPATAPTVATQPLVLPHVVPACSAERRQKREC